MNHLLIIAVFAVFLLIKRIREKGLESIREGVYVLFLEAEHRFTDTESGQRKMKYVVSLARSMLPKYVQVFISEELLQKVSQMWFDGIKDLLDDGKINQSEEEK